MPHLELREPASAWSHGVGMVLALGLSWHFYRLWRSQGGTATFPYEDRKRLALFAFGLCLVACYGSSTLYHSVWARGDLLLVLRKLDHPMRPGCRCFEATGEWPASPSLS